MQDPSPSFWGVTLKTIVTHTVTYFIAGLLALNLFNYGELFADPDFEYPMRLVTDPWVMAGPLFQPIRGLLFGLVFYTLRSVLFRPRDGWLLIWALLVVVGILSTFGPAPGSIEGMLYTTSSFLSHLRALPEILFQSFLLAVILWYWVTNPDKRRLTWVMGIAFVLVLAMGVMGVLFGGQEMAGKQLTATWEVTVSSHTVLRHNSTRSSQHGLFARLYLPGAV